MTCTVKLHCESIRVVLEPWSSLVVRAGGIGGTSEVGLQRHFANTKVLTDISAWRRLRAASAIDHYLQPESPSIMYEGYRSGSRDGGSYRRSPPRNTSSRDGDRDRRWSRKGKA